MKPFSNLGAPDPGLHQTANVCSDEDQLSDIVDWDNLSSDNASDKNESSRFSCPFIEYEAEVEPSSDDDFNNHSTKKVARKSNLNLVNYS